MFGGYSLYYATREKGTVIPFLLNVCLILSEPLRKRTGIRKKRMAALATILFIAHLHCKKNRILKGFLYRKLPVFQKPDSQLPVCRTNHSDLHLQPLTNPFYRKQLSYSVYAHLYWNRIPTTEPTAIQSGIHRVLPLGITILPCYTPMRCISCNFQYQAFRSTNRNG